MQYTGTSSEINDPVLEIPHLQPTELQHKYSETWELGTPKGLPKTFLNSKVVLFLRFISMY